MISRYLVIVLALIAAGVRAAQGAWMAAAGLLSLAVGLAMLQLAPRRPALKPLAWIAFVGTAISMAIVYSRM